VSATVHLDRARDLLVAAMAADLAKTRPDRFVTRKALAAVLVELEALRTDPRAAGGL
jgi:hypothetical protein